MKVMMAIGNAFMRMMLASPLHVLMSGSTLILRVRGLKSGRIYAVPVNYVHIEKRLLITSQRDRTWWRNLLGGAPVEVILQGKRFNARAEAYSDPARVLPLFTDYVRAAPSVARYFEIGLDAAGLPDPTDLARAARDRVMVVAVLPSDLE